MSRADMQDYDYPPGLSMARPNGYADTEPNQAGSLAGYGLSDRALSSGTHYSTLGSLSLSPTHSNMSRSAAIHDRDYNLGDGWASIPSTNRHQTTLGSPTPLAQQFNHQLPLHLSSTTASSPPHSLQNIGLGSAASGPFSPSYKERDSFSSSNRASQSTPNQPTFSPLPANPLTSASSASRTTLWWGELEPWMDEEYAKQVCGLMNWDPLSIKVPHPAPDPVTGQQANNPGYCFLTFSTQSQASNVLNQINSTGSGNPITMPNSTKPFLLNWASSTPIPPSLSPPGGVSAQQQQYPKEYSIFVGDLAPEASNSDLVAVFRNPVLGLRNDREPKFIRPFLSCKSAKIMLDPVTGVSRGYGFVRFTDEADQQRALIEMHGLYCLSRPMRISPATAKYKPPPSLDLPQVQIPGLSTGMDGQPITVAIPMPANGTSKSVSSPIATTQAASANSTGSMHSAGTGSTSSMSIPSSSASATTLVSNSSDDVAHIPQSVLSQLAQYANGNTKSVASSTPSITSAFAGGQDVNASKFNVTEEPWKHQQQARAILGNLIGPNGEQLTSTDPYNTTVFVGGLSPLISEETLRTFFAPFGEIHYVKVPVGKHCGFVQFVRKADAERAIEKMQGFPIGGSRIRLSWGRSQYKAAQAAAQAAQTAALQAHLQSQAPPSSGQTITAEQALQILQKFGLTSFLSPAGGDAAALNTVTNGGNNTSNDNIKSISESELHDLLMVHRGSVERTDPSPFEGFVPSAYLAQNGQPAATAEPRVLHDHRSSIPSLPSSFSPFSPDPNIFQETRARADSQPLKSEMLPHPSRSYAPGFGPQDVNGMNQNGIGAERKTSPTSAGRPTSTSASQRIGSFLEQTGVASYGSSRTTGSGVISRPPSSTVPRQTSPPARDSRGGEFFEHDAIHDLNGTLASLDLNEHASWRHAGENGQVNGGA